MIVMGIDPGSVSAAYALMDTADVDNFEVGEIQSIDGQIAAPLLADTMREAKPGIVVVERVHAMPGNGVAGMFRFGESVGIIHGVAAGLGIPSMKVQPALWKKEFGLLRAGKGKEIKEASRLKAMQLWPMRAGLFRRVKDANLAEALLIATFYTRFALRTS